MDKTTRYINFKVLVIQYSGTATIIMTLSGFWNKVFYVKQKDLHLQHLLLSLKLMAKSIVKCLIFR